MKVVYANAGHNFPILLRQNREPSFLDYSDLILGIMPSLQYREVAVDLQAGDRLILFTDGISEAKLRSPSGTDPMLGDDGLMWLLNGLDGQDRAADLVVGLERELDGILAKDDEADDMTILVMRVGTRSGVEVSA
jgi:sigma-B regulation protein RsbU (phosphoserine phosphatase)